MSEAPPEDLIAGEIARARLEVMVAGFSAAEAIWAHRLLLQLLSTGLEKPVSFSINHSPVLESRASVASGEQPELQGQTERDGRK